jgi:hypothetical protein
MQWLTGVGAELNLLPGGGAGSLDQVIQLYLGWARNFIMLLDSDAEGKVQYSRYKERFGTLTEQRLFLLKDFDQNWDRQGLEGIFAEGDKLAIQKVAYPEAAAYQKVHFHRAIQELLITRRRVGVQTSTRDGFLRLLIGLGNKLKEARII